jgi:hypothetical protein
MPSTTRAFQRSRRTADQWRAITDRFRTSGLNEREFCQQEDLALTSLARWLQRFDSEDGGPGFVELALASAATATDQEVWTVEVDLPGGGCLRIRSGR